MDSRPALGPVESGSNGKRRGFVVHILPFARCVSDSIPARIHPLKTPTVPRAIFTIVSNNYLHYARTLLQSVGEHHPECARFCVIVDKDHGHAEQHANEFTLIGMKELELPDFDKFIFRYSILELNTAVKPWAFEHLLANGYSEVVYIDPDIRLFAPMDDLFELLEGASDIVITPHLLAPLTDDKTPSELDIRRAGTYNFGFCALRRGSNPSAFLKWWQQKLVFGCVVDLDRGIFVDQSWIDLVPGLFASVSILRHPGYNVAYWNLAQRKFEREADGWLVNGQPLIFFHFSGFDAEYPEPFSKHQNRFTLERMGVEKEIVLEYANRLIENGCRSIRKLPYGYARFDDGETLIPDLFRKMYREDVALQDIMGANPFARSSILATTVPARKLGALSPTYAMLMIWRARSDLREVFPLTSDDSVARFHEWFRSEGGTYFSPSVVKAHDPIYSAADADPDSLDPRSPTHGAKSLLVNQLYLTLLGRQADRSGLEHFEQRVDSWRGVARCVIALAFSSESRRKPNFKARVSSAARLAVGFLASAPVAQLDAARSPALQPLDAFARIDGVNIIGYIAAESGVGESARCFARGCHAAGIPFATHDVGYQNQNRQTDRSVQELAIEGRIFGVNVMHVNADQMTRTISDLPAEFRKPDINIAYWHWEQPTLPTSFLPSFEGLTEIWVPSAFVHDAVAQISPLPVFKVPHVVEFAVPAFDTRSKFGLPADLFLVLAMYDFDSYQFRKNPQAAIAAYRAAFALRSDAGLVIKTVNGSRNQGGYAELIESVGGLPNVFLIDRYLTRAEVYELESSCDCFLSLHRAEGFGLGLAEMMYLGKPVIGTNWSGNTEFMNPMNSFPVNYELKPLENKLGVYEAGQLWAEADIDHAAHALRTIVENGDVRERITARAHRDMRRYYSASAIGHVYRKRLSLFSARRTR